MYYECVDAQFIHKADFVLFIWKKIQNSGNYPFF